MDRGKLVVNGRHVSASARRRVRGGRRVGVVLVVLALVALLTSCDWAQLGYGPGRTYANPTETTLTPASVASLHELRSITVPARTLPRPIVVGDSVVVASLGSGSGLGSARVTAYSASTGVQRWTTVVLAATAVEVGDLAASGSTVFVGAANVDGSSRVAAVSVADGSVVWSTDLADPCPACTTDLFDAVVHHAPSVTPVGDIVLAVPDTNYGIPGTCTYDQFQLTGLDRGAGTTRWSRPPVTESHGFAEPVAAGTTVAYRASYDASTGPCGSQAIGTVAIDPVTGADRWSQTVVRFEDPDSSYALSPDVGLRGRYYGTLWLGGSGGDSSKASVDAETGELNPEPRPGELFPAGQSPAVTGSIVVSRMSNGTLSAGRLSDGTVAWTAAPPAGSQFLYRPVIAGAVVYIVTADGSGYSLRTYDLRSGAALGSTPVPAADPVVANGHAFALAGTQLHVYGVA